MQYEIVGTPFPAVVCTLQRGEKMKTERGSMVWMDPCMKMETGSEGGIGGFFARTFAGEGGFQNTYTAEADGIIAFGSSFPGQILPIQIQPGQSFIAQKMAFLASEDGVQMDIHFNQKLGGGFFGGEGLFNTRLTGPGTIYLQTMPLATVADVIAAHLPKND